MAERGTHGETVTTTEARQGVTGHNVRTVLITSTVAVIVCFAILWAWYF